MMRIISGLYKGRELKSPRSDKTHPMGERERLALFNMLGDISGQTVLDLYAGTGALGIEALSRGAKSTTFVEKDPATCQIIKENLGDLNGQVVCANVENLDLSETFDLVFIDPPYNIYSADTVAKLAQYGKLAVISLPKDAALPNLNIVKDKTYARCRLLLVKAS